ncbi:DUF4362 domain-containing protein [Paenibacillus dakarensis]|uniref:DUF4362 domain-containing protein n=1 Tax=Paenibacillus dakarensis TaxID=1527293 RepID=UPI0006D53897|nr:DUF4362 domain-containing protein [Paenibacillus dakarensis]
MSKLRYLTPFVFLLFLTFILAGCSEPDVDKEKDVISMHGKIMNIEKLDAFIEKSTGTQRVVHYTIEGDPIFYVLQHKGNEIRVKYDNRQDKFGTPQVNKYTCNQLQKIDGEHLLYYKLTGCSGDRNEIEILEVPYDVSQTDTFDFVLKYGVNLANQIDSVEGKLVKDLQNGETSTVSDFQFTPAERQAIYKQMVLGNYMEEKQLSTTCNKKPHEAYDLTVYINNRVLHYEWSECDKSTDGKEMSSLIHGIIDLVKEKDVYKQLPPVKAYYE